MSEKMQTVTVSDAARQLCGKAAPATRDARKGLYGTAYTADALAAYLTARPEVVAQFAGVHDGMAYWTARTARWNYRSFVDSASAGESAGTVTVRTARVQTADPAKLATSLLLLTNAIAQRYSLSFDAAKDVFAWPMVSVDGSDTVQAAPIVPVLVRTTTLQDVCDDVTDAAAAAAAVVGYEDEARKAVNAAAQAALVKYVQTVNAQAAARTTDDSTAIATIVAALKAANAVARDDDAGANAYSAAESALQAAWTAFNQSTAPKHTGLVDLDAADDDAK